MNQRQRVCQLFEHSRPDRPVVDLGGRVASLMPAAYLSLKGRLGFGATLETERLTFLNTVSPIDESILQRFQVPFRRVYLKPAATYQQVFAADGSFRDEWGVLYRPMGNYNERTGHPLAGVSLKDLEAFAWPDPEDPGRTAGLAEEARRLYTETDYSLVAGHISAGIFQDCWNLRGMEQFMLDLVENRDFAESLLDRVAEIHIGLWRCFLDAVGEYVEVVETADDFGGQNGLLISPRLYRQMIKPRQAALYAAIREKTRARILYHSCGAVLPLVEDWIEIGVDILNPIQPLPGLMEPELLKARFGGRLIFHGGLDVQKLLVEGTQQQVREHVRRYLDVLGPEGYILAPTNTVQAGTPPENLIAAYDEALGWGTLLE